MDKILLIDGMNQIHRASISFAPPKILADNKPDYQVVFNFFRNLRPLIEQFQPDKVFFVLEGHAQFRYDLFAEYKAHRKIIKEASKKEEQDRFFHQKDIIVQLMQNLPVTIVRAANYEADDVIASLCASLKDEDLTVLSNDSDFIQLLQLNYKNIKIYNPISKKFLENPDYFYIAFKAIKGDPSDNIPGFDGFGTAKTKKLLADPDKFMEFMSLEENRANFNIYRELIEFKMVPDEELIIKDYSANWNQLKLEFQKMEFESIVNDKSWQKYISTFNCIKYWG